MRRTILLLAGLMLSGVALASDSPKEYDDKITVDPLEGTWRVTDVELNGRKGDLLLHWVTTYRGGIFSTTYSDGDTWQGKYRIDSTNKPTHLDEIPSKGRFKDQTIKNIFQIDGDTLRITNGDVEGLRPKDFKDVTVHTYKRVK